MEYFGLIQSGNSIVNKNYVDNKVDGERYVVLMPDTELSEQITEQDTIYVVKHTFDLDFGEDLEIPEGCTLKFEGGTIENGTISGNQTYIQSDPYQIFSSITLEGTWRCGCYIEWFGAKSYDTLDEYSEPLTKSIVQKALDFSEISSVKTIKFSGNIYKIDSTSDIDLTPDSGSIDILDLDLGTSKFVVTEEPEGEAVLLLGQIDNINIKGGTIDCSSLSPSSYDKPAILIENTEENTDEYIYIHIDNTTLVGTFGDDNLSIDSLKIFSCGIKISGDTTNYTGDIKANISGFFKGIEIDGRTNNNNITFDCNIDKCIKAYDFGNGAPGSVVEGIIRARPYFTDNSVYNPLIFGNIQNITFNCIFEELSEIELEVETGRPPYRHNIITTEDTSLSNFRNNINRLSYFDNTAAAFNPGCFILPTQNQLDSTYIKYIDNNLYGSSYYTVEVDGVSWNDKKNITIDGLELQSISLLPNNEAAIEVIFELPPDIRSGITGTKSSGFTHFIISVINIRCKITICGYDSQSVKDNIIKEYSTINNKIGWVYSYDLILKSPRDRISVLLENFHNDMIGVELENSIIYFEGKVENGGINQLYLNNTLKGSTEGRPKLNESEQGFLYYDTDYNQYFVWTKISSKTCEWLPINSSASGNTESDPIFTSSPAYGITSEMITGWNNKGTVSSVTMNGSEFNPTNGNINLGPVVTSETPVTIQPSGSGNGIKSISMDPNNDHIILIEKAQFDQSGGEPNKIDGIAVYGTNVTPDNNKIANITTVVTGVKTRTGDVAPLGPNENGIVDLSSQFLTSAPVTSVNGETGNVVLSIPAEVTDATVNDWGYGKIKKIKVNGREYSPTSGVANIGDVLRTQASIDIIDDKNNGNAITEISKSSDNSGHTLTITRGNFVEPSDLNDYIHKNETTGLIMNDGTVDTHSYIYNIEPSGSGNGVSNITLENGVLTITKTNFGEEGGQQNVIENITFNGDPVSIDSETKTAEIEVSIPQGTVKSIQTNDFIQTNVDSDGKINLGTFVNSIIMNDSPKLVSNSGTVNLGSVVTTETQLSKGTTQGEGNAITDISVSGHTVTAIKGTTFVYDIDTQGNGNAISNIELKNGVLRVGRGNFSTGNVIEDILYNTNNHATITNKVADLGPIVKSITMNGGSEIKPGSDGVVALDETAISIDSPTGNGNAITGIFTAGTKNHTIKVVKGKTFVETSQLASQLSNYIQKSQTAGLIKNDGTVDTSTYLTEDTQTAISKIDNQPGNAITGINLGGTKNHTLTITRGTFVVPSDLNSYIPITNSNIGLLKPNGNVDINTYIHTIKFNDSVASVSNGTATIEATIPNTSSVQSWGFAQTIYINGNPYNASNGIIIGPTNLITGISMNNNDIRIEDGVANLGDVLTTVSSPSGNGNAVTGISLSGSSITISKDKTFVESTSRFSQGNFPVFDNNGNLSDSGVNPNQYKKVVLCQTQDQYNQMDHYSDTLYLIPEVIN